MRIVRLPKYVFWWPPIGVSIGGGISQVPIKFLWKGEGGPYHVTYHDAWDEPTLPLWTDTRLWKHYLPATTVVGGNKEMNNMRQTSKKTFAFVRCEWILRCDFVVLMQQKALSGLSCYFKSLEEI